MKTKDSKNCKDPKHQCEAMISTYQPLRLGLGQGCHESKRCTNHRSVQVKVKGQGTMQLCLRCLPKFKEYATLPYTVSYLK